MLFTIVEGISLGFIYALVAMGYSLIYRTTGVVNFAQGAFVMVGGMATYWTPSSRCQNIPMAPFAVCST